uniref:Uncharacterized protein n=1 Tax=viral metagenome TaxID=1070528 RepID=A0A6C0HY10_9ZZZZ
MDKKELRKLAIKKLNTKEIQKIRKQLCQQFIGEEQKKCIYSFNKSFIKSFIKSAQSRL